MREREEKETKNSEPKRTLHGVHGLPTLLPDGMPALASGIHERLAGPVDGLRAKLH